MQKCIYTKVFYEPGSAIYGIEIASLRSNCGTYGISIFAANCSCMHSSTSERGKYTDSSTAAGYIIKITFAVMKIIPLSEGSFTVDASKQFVPFIVSEDELAGRNRGSLLVEVQPFVVVTDDDIILLDAGLGLSDEEGQFQLYKNLRQQGLNANDITKVVMSHLHKDHAGGLVNPYTRQLSFENATYHIQKQELEYVLLAGAPSYNIDTLELLQQSDKLVLEDAEAGKISDTISYEVTGAHSKFHRVIWIRDNDDVIFFGADDAPQLSQMKTRFAAKYDFDGKKAMNLREKWLQQSKQEGWRFLFYHDIKTPVYTAVD